MPDSTHGIRDTEPVLRACLFCRAPFRPNDVAEFIPHGRRVAFDPARGRLWVVCHGCGRWNLAPFDVRWEALEELERLTTDRARLLVRTDTIALLETGHLQIVRVGRTTLREEAWWRYGDALKERQRAAERTRRWGKIQDTVFAMAVIGFPIMNWRDPQVHVDKERRWRYGRYAWPERMGCTRCGKPQRGILFDEIGTLRITTSGSATRLWIYCDNCGLMNFDAGYVIEGEIAGHLLRRVLSYRNFAGAADWEVDDAAQMVSEAGSAVALTEQLTAAGTYLSAFDAKQSFALEIALNEEHERELLQLEAEQLDQRWREEERVAAIADRELS